ncbi:MAG: hypothetical protein MJ247_06800, partial [Alphaproteobacteria bacterium]|nr:hypothetical protein [Alphaproteobacteria bacterium]
AVENLEAVPEEPAVENLETVPEEPATENLEATPEEPTTEIVQEQTEEITEKAPVSNDEAFLYDGSKISTFNGSENNSTISLSNASGAFNNLSAWHLILSDLSISQIETQPGQSIPLPDEIYNQGTLITGDGSQIVFANTKELSVPSQEPDTCTLFLCGTTDISLSDQNGNTLELENPTSGMLIGPNNTKLTFNDVTKFIIPQISTNAVQTDNNVQQTTNAPKANGVMNLTLSQLDQQAFVFDGSKDETTSNETVIVKTGYSLYGWNVAFESGLNMSLSDLRTFQSKNHNLPETNGKITYKDKSLSFNNVKSIKIFEVPTYCGYGKA